MNYRSIFAAVALGVFAATTASAQFVVPGGVNGIGNSGSTSVVIGSSDSTATRLGIVDGSGLETGQWIVDVLGGYNNGLQVRSGNIYRTDTVFYAGDKDSLGIGMAVLSNNCVGIGTTKPLRPLHLYSANGFCEALWESGAVPSGSLGRIWRWGTDPSGNFNLSTVNGNLSAGQGAITVASSCYVGIGTAVPQRLLEVSGPDSRSGVCISGTDSNRSWLLGVGVGVGDGKFALYDYGASTHRLVVDTAGNVGIGTTNPANKLEVAGTVRAKEMIVETTGWSDYVFAPGYRLAPLSEVEAHIQAKGTLPGIPSAAEVADKGVSVGDMQAKLLAKLEEMTLRQIAQEKRLDGQAAEIAALKAENTALRAK